MKKNEAWVKVSSSIAAAMIGYLVLSLTVSQLSVLWKFVIVTIVGITALAVAFWGGKKGPSDDKPLPKIEVGTDIKAEGGVTLEDIEISTNAIGDAKAASNIEAKNDVAIKGISVNKKVK
ncbi:hypothetical protein [Vogesella indigofera]|uniref:hypothetical protein n=1 Tax=Vogesella indigofera TaxID=45465 RepID=UPI00234CB1F1|nr:hypothetical protein [Vogesella indigofera]MDC7703838.1 hypothetical protein [Vogesella indigofera]